MREHKGKMNDGWRKILASASFSIFLFPFFFSCSGDMKDIERFSRQNPPDQEVKEARIHRSEQGRLQVEIDAPLITRYSQPSPRTIYPRGVDLRFYDEHKKLKTTIHAQRAISFDDRNVMKASDSVVVVDYASGDTIYLEDIVWRDDEDIIFSNHPVRSVNGHRLTYGDGFTSDESLANLRISHQRGVIEFNDE